MNKELTEVKEKCNNFDRAINTYNKIRYELNELMFNYFKDFYDLNNRVIFYDQTFLKRYVTEKNFINDSFFNLKIIKERLIYVHRADEYIQNINIHKINMYCIKPFLKKSIHKKLIINSLKKNLTEKNENDDSYSSLIQEYIKIVNSFIPNIKETIKIIKDEYELKIINYNKDICENHDADNVVTLEPVKGQPFIVFELNGRNFCSSWPYDVKQIENDYFNKKELNSHNFYNVVYNINNVMSEWVDNPEASRPMNNQGKGGMPNNNLFYKKIIGNGSTVWIDKDSHDLLLEKTEELRIQYNPKKYYLHIILGPLIKKRLGHIRGHFIVSGLHGQAPGEDTTSIQKIIIKKRFD